MSLKSSTILGWLCSQ